MVSILAVAALFSPLTGWVGPRVWIGAVAGALIFLLIASLVREILTDDRRLFDRVKRRLQDNPYPRPAPSILQTVKDIPRTFLKRVKRWLAGQEKSQAEREKLPPRFTWRDEEWVTAERKETQEDAQRFRWFVFLFPVAWFLLIALLVWIAERNHAHLAWLVGLACYLLTLASANRYLEIRAKRLVQAYYFVIALNKSSAFNSAPAERKP